METNTTKTLEERFEFHSEREAYKAGFKEALDACREKMPGEFWTNYEFDPEFRDGYNTYREEALSAIDRLKV